MVQYGRPSRFSWKEFARSSFWQVWYGNGNLRKSCCNMAGRRFQIGNVSLSSLGRSSEARMRWGARCSMKHTNCMQLGSSSRMCGRNRRRRRCQIRWPCPPSPKSKLWHAGGWHLRRKQCVVFLRVWFCTWWYVLGDFKQPARKVSSSVNGICATCNNVTFLWVLLHSKCQHRSRLFTLWVRSSALRTKSCCVESVSHHVGNDSAIFFDTVSLCRVWLCFTVLSAMCMLCGTTLSHDRLGMPMEAPLDPNEDSLKKAFVEEWVSSLVLLLNVPIPKVRVMLSLRLRWHCLSHHHRGNQPPEFCAFFFWWELISLCRYSFCRWSNYF